MSSNHREVAKTLIAKSLSQLRDCAGNLHTAAPHIKMELGMVAHNLLMDLGKIELRLEDLERAVLEGDKPI